MGQSALCGERVVTDITATTAAALLEICVATHLPGMQAVLVWGVLAMLVLVKLGRGVQLIKRDLSGYKLARCNDGTAAAYYHSPDVRAASDKVLIYLPDGGDCGSVADCKIRCQEDPAKCSGPNESVLEQNRGIWSDSRTENPFADYFKIYIHYCSSDDFAGPNNRSTAAGTLLFHGKHILTATLKDLVARLGIERAGSVVLAGSCSGGRAVGYNCDFVSSAMRGVNPAVDVRCLADGPDFVPWWVRTDEQCDDKDLRKVETEKNLWGLVGDSSCVEDNKAALSSASLAHRCGVMSRYWQDIATPLFIVASQLDQVYFESNPCRPGEEDPEYRRYRAAWRKGVVALAESIQAKKPNLTSCFIPSCSSHTLLSGNLAQVYMDGVQVGEEDMLLKDVINKWLKKESHQAIDTLGKDNSQCPSPSPLESARYSSSSGVQRRNPSYHARSFNRRLLPPSSLFPKTYTRKCSLDPWYGSCGRQSISSTIGVGQAVGHGVGHGVGLGVGHGVGHGIDHDAVHTAHVEADRRKKLWQKLYTLQYLKKLFQKYKLAYAREYQAVDNPVVVREKSFPAVFRRQRPRVIVAPRRRVPSVVTVERPPVTFADVLPSVPAPEYDYAAGGDYVYAPVDYYYASYDYGEYYDYAQTQTGCNTGCALSKIVRALKLKKKNEKTTVIKQTGILPSSVGDDGNLLKSFKEFLAESDLEYEDFGPVSSQVETFDKGLLKLQERKKALI